jgi:ADP-ribosylglycohydrolase
MQVEISPNRLSGMLLGAAVGDALGLPREGLSRSRAARLFPGPLQHCLLFGRGMVSDDTEHLFMTAQSLLDAPDDADAFARRLAWRLRGWFLQLSPGLGLATAKACLKLCCGFPPQRSGVFSAGNGPAMRTAIFGVLPDATKRAVFVTASTRMTHTDPKALTGALAVAHTAALALRAPPAQAPSLDEALRAIRMDDAANGTLQEDEQWRVLVETMRIAWQERCSVTSFADRLGLQKGVSGYIYGASKSKNLLFAGLSWV